MIQVYPDREALSQAAAELFAAQAQLAVAKHGRFTVALSGGSTPKRTYELLATPALRDQVPWQHVRVFWGDERCVSATDPLSNYRMTKLALLDQIPIPEANVFPVAGDRPPAEAAALYANTVREYFGAEPPVFDLNLLGLGENGHTASLFPGTPVLHETQRWAAEVFVAESNLWRVTLTLPVLNQAALTVFLVAGADKAHVVHEIRNGPPDPERLPAQLIKPANGQLLWLLDRDAAAEVATPKSDPSL